MSISISERVVLLQDINYLNTVIPKGTVGTCRALVGDENALIQYDFQNENPCFCGVPVKFLRQALPSELDSIKNPKNLLPALYHVGQKFAIPTKSKNKEEYEVCKIVNVIIMPNELEDIFHFQDKDNNIYEVIRGFLDHCSYVSVELPKFEDEKVIVKNENSDTLSDILVKEEPITEVFNYEPKEKILEEENDVVKEYKTTSDIIETMIVNDQNLTTNDQALTKDQTLIKIIIDNFKFIITEDQTISMPSIVQFDKINEFTIALTRLKKLLKF